MAELALLLAQNALEFFDALAGFNGRRAGNGTADGFLADLAGALGHDAVPIGSRSGQYSHLLARQRCFQTARAANLTNRRASQ